jgi:hypothetical protein
MKRIALAATITAVCAVAALAFEVKKDDRQDFPKVRVTGWVQAVYENTVYHEKGKVTASGFSVKDAALMVQGDAWDRTGFRIYLQGNRRNKVDSANIFHRSYASYSARLLDAYVDWKPSPLYSFRLGQYKKQFGLEQGTSPVDLDFIYESQITRSFLDNNRDQGLMAYGKWRDLNYWLSLHNGASCNLKDKNWAKDVTARAVYSLPWPGLKAGGSAEYGTADGSTRGLYRRRAGLEANWEWRKLFVRGEFMIGRDDKTVSDSLSRTTSRTVTDTMVSWSYDSVGGAWVPTVTFSNRTVTSRTWTKKTLVDQALARGGYLTVGYVVIPNLRLAVRGDLYRNDYAWKLALAGTDTSWTKREARTLIWNLGADYFLNKVTKVTVNYDIKQEDMALPLVRNNVLTAMVQAKF